MARRRINLSEDSTGSEQGDDLDAMEEAWRAHVGRLTLDALSSSEAVRLHLEKFQVSLVGEGLEQTPLSSLEDVHDLIARFLTMRPAIHATAMRRLTLGQRDFFRAQAVEEIIGLAKQRSMEGRSNLAWEGGKPPSLDKLASFKAFMTDEGGEYVRSKESGRTLPRVLAKLEELGYKMEYNREEWTKYNFAMSWDCWGEEYLVNGV